MLDIYRSDGPAPAYTIESDSEDDRWDEDPGQAKQPKDGPVEPAKTNHESNKTLEWHPNRPQPRFGPDSTLLVLIGDPGLLVGSGLPEELVSQSDPFNQLDRYILVSDSGHFTLSPAHVPLQLQTCLARKLLSDLQPPSLTIVSSYPAPTYIPPTDEPPIRYLASTLSSNHALPQTIEKLGGHHFQVPNLIKGFEAALMIQATILKIECGIILLPAISRPHDEKSSTSIATGQYDFSAGSTDHDLPKCLLSIEDRNLRTSLKQIMDQLFLNHHHHRQGKKWEFPKKINPLLRQILKLKFDLDSQLNPKIHLNSHRLDDRTSTKDISLMYM